ncbi:Histidine kinase-, DNA gyrase B-, and HSP90-like ATPase [uncultured archaeon]|nr:Histidine kinase-, DNA gyrase B-, and HSP90-like ATPase [uncultured archaeon]
MGALKPDASNQPASGGADALFSSSSFAQMLKAALYNMDMIGGGQVRLTPLLPTFGAQEQQEALQKVLDGMGRNDVAVEVRDQGLYLRKLPPKQNEDVVLTHVQPGTTFPFRFPPVDPGMRVEDVLDAVLTQQLGPRMAAMDPAQAEDLKQIYGTLAERYRDDPTHEHRVDVTMGEDGKWKAAEVQAVPVPMGAKEAMEQFRAKPGVESALDAIRAVKTEMDGKKTTGAGQKKYDSSLRQQYLLPILSALTPQERTELVQKIGTDPRFEREEKDYLRQQLAKTSSYVQGKPALLKLGAGLKGLDLPELQERMKRTVDIYLSSPGSNLGTAAAQTFNKLFADALGKCTSVEQYRQVVQYGFSLVSGTYLQKITYDKGEKKGQLVIDIEQMAKQGMGGPNMQGAVRSEQMLAFLTGKYNEMKDELESEARFSYARAMNISSYRLTYQNGKPVLEPNPDIPAGPLSPYAPANLAKNMPKDPAARENYLQTKINEMQALESRSRLQRVMGYEQPLTVTEGGGTRHVPGYMDLVNDPHFLADGGLRMNWNGDARKRADVGFFLLNSAFAAEQTADSYAAAPGSERGVARLRQIAKAYQQLEKDFKAGKLDIVDALDGARDLQKQFDATMQKLPQDLFVAGGHATLFGMEVDSEFFRWTVANKAAIGTVVFTGMSLIPGGQIGSAIGFTYMAANDIYEGIRSGNAEQIIMGSAMLLPFAGTAMMARAGRLAEVGEAAGALRWTRAGTAASRTGEVVLYAGMGKGAWEIYKGINEGYFSYSSDIGSIGSLVLPVGIMHTAKALKTKTVSGKAEVKGETAKVPAEVKEEPGTKTQMPAPNEVETKTASLETGKTGTAVAGLDVDAAKRPLSQLGANKTTDAAANKGAEETTALPTEVEARQWEVFREFCIKAAEDYAQYEREHPDVNETDPLNNTPASVLSKNYDQLVELAKTNELAAMKLQWLTKYSPDFFQSADGGRVRQLVLAGQDNPLLMEVARDLAWRRPQLLDPASLAVVLNESGQATARIMQGGGKFDYPLALHIFSVNPALLAEEAPMQALLKWAHNSRDPAAFRLIDRLVNDPGLPQARESLYKAFDAMTFHELDVRNPAAQKFEGTENLLRRFDRWRDDLGTQPRPVLTAEEQAQWNAVELLLSDVGKFEATYTDPASPLADPINRLPPELFSKNYVRLLELCKESEYGPQILSILIRRTPEIFDDPGHRRMRQLLGAAEDSPRLWDAVAELAGERPDLFNDQSIGQLFSNYPADQAPMWLVSKLAKSQPWLMGGERAMDALLRFNAFDEAGLVLRTLNNSHATNAFCLAAWQELPFLQSLTFRDVHSMFEPLKNYEPFPGNKYPYQEVPELLRSMQSLEARSPGAVADLYNGFGIRRFDRYSAEEMAQQHDNQQYAQQSGQAPQTDKPVLLWITAVNDHNGVFATHSGKIQNLKNDFNVIYVEAGNKLELASRFGRTLRAYNPDNQPVTVAVNMHGSGFSGELGSGRHGDLNTGDVILNRNYDPYLPAGSAVLWISCKLGQEGGLAHKFMQKYDKYFVTGFDGSTGFDNINYMGKSKGYFEFDITPNRSDVRVISSEPPTPEVKTGKAAATGNAYEPAAQITPEQTNPVAAEKTAAGVAAEGEAPKLSEKQMEEQAILHDAKNAVVACDTPTKALQMYLDAFAESPERTALEGNLSALEADISIINQGFDKLSNLSDPAYRAKLEKQKADISGQLGEIGPDYREEAQKKLDQINRDLADLDDPDYRERLTADLRVRSRQVEAKMKEVNLEVDRLMNANSLSEADAADIGMFNNGLRNNGADLHGALGELRALDETGVHQPEVGEYNIVAAVRNYFKSASKSGSKFGANVSVLEVGPDGTRREAGDHFTALYDPTLLRRAVGNLCSNAERYGNSKAWMEVEITPTEVRIRVMDDGPGFRPQDVGRAFDFKSGIENYGNKKSSQVGLSTVKLDVEKMGGTVAITDGPQLGGGPTTVEIRLPRGKGVEGETGAEIKAPATGAEGEVGGGTEGTGGPTNGIGPKAAGGTEEAGTGQQTSIDAGYWRNGQPRMNIGGQDGIPDGQYVLFENKRGKGKRWVLANEDGKTEELQDPKIGQKLDQLWKKNKPAPETETNATKRTMADDIFSAQVGPAEIEFAGKIKSLYEKALNTKTDVELQGILTEMETLVSSEPLTPSRMKAAAEALGIDAGRMNALEQNLEVLWPICDRFSDAMMAGQAEMGGSGTTCIYLGRDGWAMMFAHALKTGNADGSIRSLVFTRDMMEVGEGESHAGPSGAPAPFSIQYRTLRRGAFNSNPVGQADYALKTSEFMDKYTAWFGKQCENEGFRNEVVKVYDYIKANGSVKTDAQGRIVPQNFLVADIGFISFPPFIKSVIEYGAVHVDGLPAGQVKGGVMYYQTAAGFEYLPNVRKADGSDGSGLASVSKVEKKRLEPVNFSEPVSQVDAQGNAVLDIGPRRASDALFFYLMMGKTMQDAK